MKVSNREARPHVKARRDFTGSNTYGVNDNGVYTVYSYGTHWPMFCCVGGRWFENDGRYSPTTSKHRSQLHPHEPTIPVPLSVILRIASGYAAIGETLAEIVANWETERAITNVKEAAGVA